MEEEQHSQVCIDMMWSPLPQPDINNNNNNVETRYKYILYEDIETTYFQSSTSRLSQDTLCWILKSKGSGKGERELFLRARVVSDDDVDDDNNDNKNKQGQQSVHSQKEQQQQQLKDNDRRVLIRYPKGSTYHVKRSNLIPVLDQMSHQNIVIVVPETPDYRRAAVVHTCIHESFLEIGCSYGPTVDRMRKVLTEIGHVHPITKDQKKQKDEPPSSTSSYPCTKKMKHGCENKQQQHQQQHEQESNKNSNGKDNNNIANDSNNPYCRVYALGIDKSEECIDIAINRYPKSLFSLEDALTQDGMVQLRSLCQQKLVNGYPSVVAIDINGTRELPAVLQCIENQMKPGNDVTVGKDWELPRLFIVKSRTLYSEIKKRQGLGLQC